MIRIVNVRRRGLMRNSVCYCGRRAAGWLASPWANPFKLAKSVTVEQCLATYREWLENHPEREELLADLWDACEHGAKPLGCWCVNAVVGDGSPIVCHAQILGEELAKRFLDKEQVNEDCS